MQPNGPSADLELRTLRQTRRFIFLRAVFCASGILFTLLPLVFTFDDRGVEFLLLGHQPGLVWSFWTIAAACWTACYAMHRQVRQSGLLVDGTCATVMEDRNAYSCVDVETCGFELSFERCLRDAMIMI